MMAEEVRNNDAGVNLVELRETLVSRFSESDLRNLAFDLDIEYNDLPGDGRADKARETIANCRRQSRIPELLLVCARLRSDVSLPRSPQKPAPESAPDASDAPFKPIHQLRTPVKDFIGRAAEINELVHMLGVAASGTVGATAIICGPSGLGKSRPATHRKRTCQSEKRTLRTHIWVRHTKWRPGRDLNPRHLVPKTSALSTELPGHIRT